MSFSVGIKPGQSKTEYMIDLLHHCNKYIYFHSGLKLQQDEILRQLNDNGSMSQKEIQERLGVQAASVSEIVTKLENRGLVTRERSEDDRRVVNITLTPEGKEIAKKELQVQRKEAKFSNFPEEDMDKLIELLESLHETMLGNINCK